MGIINGKPMKAYNDEDGRLVRTYQAGNVVIEVFTRLFNGGSYGTHIEYFGRIQGTDTPKWRGWIEWKENYIPTPEQFRERIEEERSIDPPGHAPLHTKYRR